MAFDGVEAGGEGIADEPVKKIGPVRWVERGAHCPQFHEVGAIGLRDGVIDSGPVRMLDPELRVRPGGA